MKRFNTPAYQAEEDFKNQPEALKTAFLNAWSNYVKYCTINSQMGNPWSAKYDHPRSWYYNALETKVIPTKDNTVPIQWTAFPHRVKHYFEKLFLDKFKDNTQDKLFEFADIGPRKFAEQEPDIDLADLEIPKNSCTNPPSGGKVAFWPNGPRGWQDEYCEWAVKRDQDNNIIAVDFTFDNPEYWFHMWRISPELVLSLYQKILGNESIVLDDLCLKDDKGDVVIVRQTGRPAYNPINKWNNGSEMTETSGGAIHLTSRPNTLGAEIYLGAAATILREKNGKVINDTNELICTAGYGQIFRNSDPRIGLEVNQLVQQGLKVTLTNPIALYGQQPNFNLFTQVTQ